MIRSFGIEAGAHFDFRAIIGQNIDMPQPRHAIFVDRDAQPVLIEDHRLRREP